MGVGAVQARALETAVGPVGERTVRQVQFVRPRVVAWACGARWGGAGRSTAGGAPGCGQLGPAGAGVAPSAGW
ncbi:hypothetical protein SAZ_27715 [Streptomyces noursei ZPM]|nr:hypothetical protein SAZ_27715 [Streptomyces noursei ZPM]EXU85322.1 hypothetical protein P354_11105 [Streptomyces noursei PD-1]